MLDAPLATYLLGRWTVRRTAADRRRGQHFVMTGEAEVAAESTRLVHDESVAWHTGARAMTGRRRYLIQPTGPWRAEVLFADGRPFHELDLSTGRTTFAHHCPPDCYHGWCVLDGADSYRTGWTVIGPRKDLALATTFRRANG